MGISASVDIGFGVNLEDESPYESFEDNENFSGELGEYLALRAGHTNPWDNMPEGYSYQRKDEFPEFRAALEKWDEITSRLDKEAPIKIVHHGMPVYDYNAYAIFLKEPGVDVRYSGEIVGRIEDPSPDAIEAAQEFCDANGLPEFSSPAWLAVTNVG